MRTQSITTSMLFRNDARTPLGRLTAAGFIKDSTGIRGGEPRVLGSYAIVYLLEGSGQYSDAHHERAVRAGDMMLIFPEIAHTYGPDEGEHWSELYVVFEGLAFDLWRQAGLFSHANPIQHLEPIDVWLARFTALLQPVAVTPVGRAFEISRFLQLLTDVFQPSATFMPNTESTWIEHACTLLGADLATTIDVSAVAHAVGMTYETFRKHFQRQTGVSPIRYRSIRRIDAACSLLQSRHITIANIALQLGFSDEYHFSRRFKQITGFSPRTFRQRLPTLAQG